jgi:hypothetical protein
MAQRSRPSVQPTQRPIRGAPEQISAGLGPHVIYPSCTPHPPARQFPRDEGSRVCWRGWNLAWKQPRFPPAFQLPSHFISSGLHRVSAVCCTMPPQKRSTPKGQKRTERPPIIDLSHHPSPITPACPRIEIDKNMLYEENRLKICVVA